MNYVMPEEDRKTEALLGFARGVVYAFFIGVGIALLLAWTPGGLQ